MPRQLIFLQEIKAENDKEMLVNCVKIG